MTVASTPNRIGRTGSSGSSLPIFSGDGSHIVFISAAKNLVTNDDLRTFYDVFVRDLTSSNTTLVSVNNTGTGGGNAHSLSPSISSNGQVVAFASAASNLALNDTNRVEDVFVRDLASGTTFVASVSQDGVSTGDGSSINPMISADGRFVVFQSAASNLVPNDTNGTTDIFVRDLLAGTTTLVSLNAAGTSSGNGPSRSPVISSDGRFVAFVSTATDLIPGATNNSGEVYVRDLLSGATYWASAHPVQLQSHACSNPVLTPDGRFVAFNATGSAVVRYDLQGGTNAWRWRSVSVSDDTISISDNGRYVTFSTPRSNDWSYYNSYNATNAIFRMDAESQYSVIDQGTMNPRTNLIYGVLEPIPPPVTNSPSAAFWAFAAPAMSSDGNRIAFVTVAAPFYGGSNAFPPRLYVQDMAAQATVLVSSNLNSDLGATVPSESPDGTQVAFESSDGGIIADDLNQADDVFVYSLGSGATDLVSERDPSLPAVTGIGVATLSPSAFSGPGDRLIFLGSDNTLVPDDKNHWHDLFYYDLAAGTNLALGWPGTVFDVSGDGWYRVFVTNYLARSNSAAFPLISADGRFVAFEQAAAYVGGVTNVVRYDVLSHLARNVGTDYAYPAGNILRGEALSMSQDGRFVAFETPELTSRFQSRPYSISISDNNNDLDVILRDFGDPWMTNIGTHPAIGVNQQVVSVNRFGAVAGNKASWKPLVSPDGRWVIFSSLATDLTTNVFPNASVQLFARSVASNRTKLLSRDTNGVALSGGASNAVISYDSRYVFFQGASTNFAIYRHDLLSDSVTTMTLIHQNGTNFLQSSTVLLPNILVCTNCASPSPGADGRLIAFETRREGTPNDIFVHNVELGTDELISADFAGRGGGNGNSYRPLLSYDGRFVVFASKAGNLVSNDFNCASDIFLRDRWKGRTTLLSSNYSGNSANGPSSEPVLAPDGRTVAFQSFASDLVAGDYNERRDIFVLKLGSPDTDGDGMDDDWERYFFGSLARDGGSDFDGDGRSDLEEFRAGSDPSTTGSVLSLLTVTTITNGWEAYSRRDTTIYWQAAPGRTYRVLFKENLTVPWTDVPGDIVAGATKASKLHSTLVPFLGWRPPPTQRFYRVLLIE